MESDSILEKHKEKDENIRQQIKISWEDNDKNLMDNKR